MVFRSTPVKRLSNGRYKISISHSERQILGQLPSELMKQIDSADDDGSTFRLFPPGYSQDLGRQVEYDRLMRDDLHSSHLQSLQVLGETSTETELDEEQVNAWVKAVNQLRLVLGTRLDVTEDMTEDDFAPDDPRASAYELYGYLGYLQECLVEALLKALPEPTED